MEKKQKSKKSLVEIGYLCDKTFILMQRSKYLVASSRDMLWGLTVSTVGYDDVAPGEDYPTHGHADGYYFNPEHGRTLNEYQILYLVEGTGVFRSAHKEPTEIHAGDMFVLFPGEWHTYYPLKGTQWKSYWIGFKGRNMDDRVKAGFLTPEKPIYRVGFTESIIRLYRDAYRTAVEEMANSQQIMAGMVNFLIGLMYAFERNKQLTRDKIHVDVINRARLRIRESLESELTIQQIAEECGISYSNFRKLFKEYTGIAPALYQQELRIQRAKELLSATDLSVKEIAYRLNFDSSDYFSSKFRAKVGMSPGEYRRKTG